jgi:hypothetical protein
MMDFPSYLQSKKISTTSFQKGHPSLFEEWEGLFAQLSIESFTAQKLYLINNIRRMYPQEVLPLESTITAQPIKAKPKVIIKPKQT